MVKHGNVISVCCAFLRVHRVRLGFVDFILRVVRRAFDLINQHLRFTERKRSKTSRGFFSAYSVRQRRRWGRKAASRTEKRVWPFSRHIDDVGFCLPLFSSLVAIPVYVKHNISFPDSSSLGRFEITVGPKHYGEDHRGVTVTSQLPRGVLNMSLCRPQGATRLTQSPR